MSDSLAGKVALVTGGSRGIGRGIATRLAADGALVAVHYATNSQAAAETVTSIEVNTRAPFFLTQAAAERMGPGGRIITISSGVTRQAVPNLLAYSMSKAAIDVMARTLAKELAPRGITVNVVASGLVDTDMNAAWLRASDEAREQAASVSAFGRIDQPSDIADVVAFTASEDARWITGQVLDATGGSVL
jgi:NAD(P)-dependent dehydrogenase (short-subunit alcohol dehydrogenase family)